MGSLADDLLRPENHPPPPPARVSLAATHASWVFLTDTEAWKVKKPVRFEFLDYGSPELRKHCCEEEVRLNRRLAPDVYLGVAAVYLDGRGHSLGRPGRIVDWAVRMRLLPDDASAASMLAAGRLDPGRLDRLVDVLVPFYGAARTDARFASTRELDLLFSGTIAQAPPGSSGAAGADAMLAWSRDFLRVRSAAFERRIADGRIREGHGDLRLEHVYFEGDAPIVIDAIDFSERYRCIDVAADVAFLAMELEAAGRRDLAEGFLARFARMSNDYDLFAVVDVYIAYRAWVRANVAMLVANDPSAGEPRRADKRLEADRRYAQALAVPRRPAAPLVVAVGGMIGSGKTTLAEALSRELGAPVVSSDLTRKFLAGLRPTDRGPMEIYLDEMTRRTFDELFRRGDVVLGSGRPLILDASFSRRDLRGRARDLAAARRCPFLFVETRCDEARLRERLRRRAMGPSVSDADERLLDRFQKDFEPAVELETGERLSVDTTGPVERAVAEVASVLGRITRPAGPRSDPAAPPATPG